jgi:hypothetical protein
VIRYKIHASWFPHPPPMSSDHERHVLQLPLHHRVSGCTRHDARQWEPLIQLLVCPCRCYGPGTLRKNGSTINYDNLKGKIDTTCS